MKKTNQPILIVFLISLFGCSIAEPESEWFTISGIVTSSNPNQARGDHFYIYGFEKSGSDRKDRFEFSEIIPLREDGQFSFGYQSNLNTRQASKTDKNFILDSGEPLINNPERLVWNTNYEDIRLTLDFD